MKCYMPPCDLRVNSLHSDEMVKNKQTKKNNPPDGSIASDNTSVISARTLQKLNAVNKIISALHAAAAKSTSAKKRDLKQCNYEKKTISTGLQCTL